LIDHSFILGLITAFEVDELQSWLAVGTGSGYIDIWDMRFQLCIQGMRHPTGKTSNLTKIKSRHFSLFKVHVL
jgi:hypothetical protein